mmetsp:Transcript_50331/g.114366  ORF Transcript_50331/g.114366 Transcript_50331/m.114366 type:complete len:265 (+) Transcript_50331:1015-1809(+)
MSCAGTITPTAGMTWTRPPATSAPGSTPPTGRPCGPPRRAAYPSTSQTAWRRPPSAAWRRAAYCAAAGSSPAPTSAASSGTRRTSGLRCSIWLWWGWRRSPGAGRSWRGTWRRGGSTSAIRPGRRRGTCWRSTLRTGTRGWEGSTRCKSGLVGPMGWRWTWLRAASWTEAPAPGPPKTPALFLRLFPLEVFPLGLLVGPEVRASPGHCGGGRPRSLWARWLRPPCLALVGNRGAQGPVACGLPGARGAGFFQPLEWMGVWWLRF